MANTSIEGRKYWLRARTGAVTNGVAAFETVACITSLGFNLTKSTATSNTRCSGDWSRTAVTSKSWTMPIEGEAAIDPDNGFMSADRFFDLAKSDQEIEVMLYNIDEDNYPDDIRRGTVIITDFAETFPQDGFRGFTATLTGQGEPFRTPAA